MALSFERMGHEVIYKSIGLVTGILFPSTFNTVSTLKLHPPTITSTMSVQTSPQPTEQLFTVTEVADQLALPAYPAGT